MSNASLALPRCDLSTVFVILNIVVKRSQGELDELFSALADPTRRDILVRLAEGESPVTKLAEPLPMSLPAVSRHVRVLESAGLVARRKEGRVHRISLVAEPMLEALEWMAVFGRFWEHQLDALEHFFASQAEQRDTK
jgi:DNA-binding transcriptional ArsR family regulator